MRRILECPELPSRPHLRESGALYLSVAVPLLMPFGVLPAYSAVEDADLRGEIQRVTIDPSFCLFDRKPSLDQDGRPASADH